MEQVGSSSLRSIRRSAHAEVDDARSRISKRLSSMRVLERGPPTGLRTPVRDPRCRGDSGEFVSIDGIAAQEASAQAGLRQARQGAKKMVNDRISYHVRTAQWAIAEAGRQSRTNGKHPPRTLLAKVARALEPLTEHKASTKRIRSMARRKSMVAMGALRGLADTRLTAGGGVSLVLLPEDVDTDNDIGGGGSGVKTRRVDADRLAQLERSVAELEGSAVSQPELEAKFQIVQHACDVRASKIEKQLDKHSEFTLSREEAVNTFQQKKTSAKILARLYEMATNQVRTVIASESKSIISSTLLDMEKKRQATALLTGGDSGIGGFGGGGGGNQFGGAFEDKVEDEFQDKQQQEGDAELFGDLELPKGGADVSSSASLLADKMKDNLQLQALMNTLNMAFGMPDAPRKSQFATQLRKFLTMVVTSSLLNSSEEEDKETRASSEEVQELKTTVEELSEKLEAVTAEATSDRVQLQEAVQGLAEIKFYCEENVARLQFDVGQQFAALENIKTDLRQIKDEER